MPTSVEIMVLEITTFIKKAGDMYMLHYEELKHKEGIGLPAVYATATSKDFGWGISLITAGDFHRRQGERFVFSPSSNHIPITGIDV